MAGDFLTRVNSDETAQSAPIFYRSTSDRASGKRVRVHTLDWAGRGRPAVLARGTNDCNINGQRK